MPIMIWLAIFVEVGITIANQVTEGSPGTNWIDAVILLAIQFINATLGWYETIKAADAVAALRAPGRPCLPTVSSTRAVSRWTSLP
jgi:H+-transporting ATPase